MFDPPLKNYNLTPSCGSTVRSLPSAGKMIQKCIKKFFIF